MLGSGAAAESLIYENMRRGEISELAALLSKRTGSPLPLKVYHILSGFVMAVEAELLVFILFSSSGK